MESTRRHLEQQQGNGGGMASDLRRLKTESSASADELREFLGQLKGRSPEEVMGAVAQSDLIRSILTATVACAVLLLALTIIPYLLNGGSSSAQKQSASESTSGQATDNVEAAPTTTETDGDASVTASNEPDMDRAAEAMGIGEAADADASTNPLDSRLDNLLDGIE